MAGSSLVLGCVALAATLASGSANVRQPERVSVIVELDGPGTGAKSAAVRRAVRGFAARRGARVHYEYHLIEAFNLRDVPVDALAELESLPGIRRVTLDSEYTAALVDSVGGMRALQAQIVEAGRPAGGAGVRICVVDTGILTDHVLFRNGKIDLAASYDYQNGDSDPTDDNGHGTHVAAIAAGRAGYTLDSNCHGQRPVQGVAPEARLIAVKALNGQARGVSSNLIAAIEHCASPGLPGGPAHVLNLSLSGGPATGTCDDNVVVEAANRAAEAGLLVVAAAGNSGLDGALTAPACGSRVLAVGATYDATFPNCEDPTQSFTFCTFHTGSQVLGCIASCTDVRPTVDDRVCSSNQGALLDVVAPGCSILSATHAPPSNRFTELCGTSMATAHVSGLAALLLSFHPELGAAGASEAILGGATDLGAPGFDFAFGHGRVDAVAALARIEVCDGLDDDDDAEVDENCVCRDPIDSDADGIGDACDLDDDGDGVADLDDCAPLDPATHERPPEIAGLVLGPSKADLAWEPTPSRDAVYELRRGALDELATSPGASEVCLGFEIVETSASDSDSPAPGDGFWYRVRGRNPCGNGSFGEPAGVLPRRLVAPCP